MFKKRNRQNTNRRGRNKEESSEEEQVTPVIHQHNSNSGNSVRNVSASTLLDDQVSKSSISISRMNQKSKMQSSLFSSNKPKFSRKIDLSKNYDDTPVTDGIDSLQPKEVELNINDIKKLSKEQSSDETTPNPQNDFIPLPNTQSLRAMLRRRNLHDESEETPAIPSQQEDGAEDLSISSSDEEARWERHLVERGVSGPTVHHTLVESISHAGASESFTMVSQDHVIRRLTAVLNDLRVNYDETVRLIAHAEQEIEEIEAEDKNEFANKLTTEHRYAFYQKETLFFRKLSGYLTDKRAELEQLYTAYETVTKQYKWSNDYINQLYVLDDIHYLQQLECVETVINELPRVVDLSEVREQCGVFYKGDIYYDPSFTQSRSADRTLYIDQAETISESILECEEGGEKVHRITCPVEFYWTNSIFYNYNDQSTEQALSKLGELRAKIQSVFDRRALQLMSIEQVLGHFKQWREEYPEDYENAYVSLSIDDFIPVILFPSLLSYDPLELQEEGVQSINELPWFTVLKEFCETTTQQRDTLLLPRFVQKHVISFLNNIVMYEWNPLSIREATLLQQALTEVASYFNSVIGELRSLYASVTQRIQQAIQSTVYFVPALFSERSRDIVTDAQEITELYIARGIRLLEVVNTLAPFMTLGTPAPCLDNLVSMMCAYLKGLAKQPCLRERCGEFAVKIDSLIPREVTMAKQMIQSYL